MICTSEKAFELLNSSRGKAKDDDWIGHSICVGETAFTLAKALGLDADFAKTLGLLHDIGKRFGFSQEKSHGYSGYEYLKNLGFDEKYASVCLTHSYLNNDMNCTAGEGATDLKRPGAQFTYDYIKNHTYSVYEEIICLCDLLCRYKVMVLEKRLVDLLIRHGIFQNTIYHIKEAVKLKKKFDDMLGYNLYELFPGIEMN